MQHFIIPDFLECMWLYKRLTKLHHSLISVQIDMVLELHEGCPGSIKFLSSSSAACTLYQFISHSDCSFSCALMLSELFGSFFRYQAQTVLIYLEFFVWVPKDARGLKAKHPFPISVHPICLVAYYREPCQ